MKILLAEDTQDLNRVLTAALQYEGYEVDSVFDGGEAVDKIMQNGYDAMVLDIMMPVKDGLEVLREVRALNNVTPVLMLTAKAEVDDRVAGLDAGADDYLTKPFAMKELLARVRSMTRRKNAYSTAQLSFGDITLAGDKFELRSENSIRLSVKEYELLQLLILNAGKETSTTYILDHVWADTEGADAETVWLYISYLKGKLQSVASDVTIAGEAGSSFQLIMQ